MSPLLDLISPTVMADLALKSVAVMLLALVAAAILWRASAAWRHLVWTLSVASLLLLPALSLALPAWSVAWLPQWDSPAIEVVTSEPMMSPLPKRSESIHDGSPTATVAQTSDSAPATNAGDMPNAVPSELSRPQRGPTWWLSAGWFVGVIASLVPLAIGLWRLAILGRASHAIDESRWLALLNEARRKLAVRRDVQLRESEAALVPLTWGAVRPVLLVPAEANAWPAERRRLVLLHELAHVRRWDWLTQILAHVACALFWFNPLVWLAARQMRVERERACDDLVLAAGARASEYAQELLTLAASLSESRLSTLVAVPMARRGALEDRIRGILDNRRSRAALTAAVICLGAALTAAALAPLAMLRAAQPQPEQRKPAVNEPTINKIAQRDQAPDENKAREDGIRLSVLNSAGDKGIPEFRVIAGVTSGSVTSEFEKRTGRAVINWQPHTCVIGKGGDYVWPLARAYDEMALRVEADGYQPQVFTGIKKANGVQHLVFQLAEDKGVVGRVLTPAGEPVAGATVALGLCQKDIVWEEGKLRGAGDPLPEKPGDRWRRPLFVTTDKEGRFRLPTEIEPAAVLVIHESGVRELAYDAWQKSPEVTLQPWGKIIGQVLWGTKPGVDEEVTLSVHRDEYGYPGMIAGHARTKTDNTGRFTFDRVLPGAAQISRPIKPVKPSNITGVIFNGMFQHAKVAAGGETKVLIGGQGRKVTGKLVGLDTWEGATFHMHPNAPHIGFAGDDATWEAFGQLKTSPIGPLLFRDKQQVNKDGSISIENMLPGQYQLFVSAPGFKNYAASARIEVGPETLDEKPTPLDLGVIAKMTKPAEEAPPKPVEKPAEKPAAKTVTISRQSSG
jgi:beta-lactamase regulating signal transducer with metallopeptidase domain